MPSAAQQRVTSTTLHLFRPRQAVPEQSPPSPTKGIIQYGWVRGYHTQSPVHNCQNNPTFPQAIDPASNLTFSSDMCYPA